jgi:segregation and condensation protein B
MKDWQRIEAVLFGSGRYLTEEQIVQLSGVSKKNLKKSLDELKKHYVHIDSSLDVFKENESWKLNVKEEYSHIVKNVISEAELSKPLMETLALVAYKSPVFQSEIIDMKGAGAYEYISLLEEKGFITKEKSGRTFKLKITPKFYDYFDISGDSKLRQMFKNVKKPEAMGSLEVYNQENKTDEEKKDEEFSDKILERMKKVELNPSDHEEKKKFLENFDSRFAKTKTDIDETDNELNEFRKIVPLQTEQTAQQEGEESDNQNDREKPKRNNNDPDRKEEEKINELTNETDEEELNESDNNYSDKILRKFERALDKLDSPETEEGEKEAEEEETEEENEEEILKNKTAAKEEKKPSEIKKEKTERIFPPEKIEKIKEMEIKKSIPPKKEKKENKKEDKKEEKKSVHAKNHAKHKEEKKKGKK